MLNQYISDTQDLLNDAAGQFFQIPRLTSYINKSRRRIAAASGCLRVVPSGTLTIPGQEIYPVKAWDALVQRDLRGAQTTLFVNTISIGIGGRWSQDGRIVGGSWKPTWRQIPWSDFQSRFRLYGSTFIGTISDPGWWAELGVGPSAKIYLAPIPTQYNPMELDLTCIPFSLLTDDDPEPITYPWTDAVAYWAAMFCLIQQQRLQDAQAMATLYNNDLPFCASVVKPRFIANPYGAALRSA